MTICKNAWITELILTPYTSTMQFRKIITKLGQIPYNGILCMLVILSIYIHPAYIFYDLDTIHNWIIPLSMKICIFLWSTIFCSYILGAIIKGVYYKPRPIPQPYTNRWQKIDASSFPSMHTAISCIIAYYGSLVAYIFTDWCIRYTLITFWSILFILIAISRKILKKHFTIDILAWVVFGAICIRIIMVVWSKILL